MQAINAEIVRAHHASLQPDAVLTTSVMEGFGFGDHCPAPLRPARHSRSGCALRPDPASAGEGISRNTRLQAAFYQRQIEVLKRTDLLLAISRSSRDDAIRLLGIGEERVATISVRRSRSRVRNSSSARTARRGATRGALRALRGRRRPQQEHRTGRRGVRAPAGGDPHGTCAGACRALCRTRRGETLARLAEARGIVAPPHFSVSSTTRS